MNRAIIIMVALTFLQGCSLPLIGSLSTSTVTGVTTGNYQRSAISSAIDFGVHEATGKTPTQHLLDIHKKK
tara:strand:+ start:6731 stop:6943 length:213 start_codon:yes stop_codon:yes gene_type:complete